MGLNKVTAKGHSSNLGVLKTMSQLLIQLIVAQ
jgi:hypothetical protein